MSLSHYCILLLVSFNNTVKQNCHSIYAEGRRPNAAFFQYYKHKAQVKIWLPALLILETRNLTFPDNKHLAQAKAWPQTLQHHNIYDPHS